MFEKVDFSLGIFIGLIVFYQSAKKLSYHVFSAKKIFVVNYHKHTYITYY